MLRRKLWLAAALLLLAAGAASAGAQTAPSDTGSIVFSRAEGRGLHFSSLFTVAPDTGQLRRVTRAHGWDWFPAWSPNGRRIAFARFSTTSQDLYVVGANGKGLHRLVHMRWGAEWPTWSPDGSKIAFEVGPRLTKTGQAITHRELWVVGANGHGLKQLTRNNADDVSPAWSPDGKRIAFVRSVKNHGRIWVISAQGRNAHPLGLKGGEPAWSPDGSQLAFAHARSGVGSETVDLYVANADGSGLRRLTHEPVGVVSHHPSWSPDGSSIVYMSRRGLWTIGSSGQGARQLTRTSTEDLDPDWLKPATPSRTG